MHEAWFTAAQKRLYAACELQHEPLSREAANLDVGEHASGRAAVEVSTAVERFNHGLAGCHVGKDAQLQLAVVCHDQRTAGRGPERFANEVPVLLQCRLVLQVGPAAR